MGFKRKRPNTQEKEKKEISTQKNLMQPIEYVETSLDEYGWKPVPFDSKTFGSSCNLMGIMSISKIEGDEAEKLLRKYEKSKEKLTKLQDKGKSTNKKAAPTPGEDPARRKGGQKKQEVANEARESSILKKKKKKKKRQQADVAAGGPGEAVEGQGEEEEDHEGNEEVDVSEQTPKIADEDYDDQWEYEEWNCVMLRKCLVKALKEQGFEQPTAIQELVIPAAMAKRQDIFGAAETGSGKTLAFALPMLQRILDSHNFSGIDAKERKLAGLVLSPTRELAIQVRDHIVAAARFTKIKVVAVVGGLSMQKQQRQLAMHPHIVVGTPGRLWEQMRLGNEYLRELNMLLCLVIDEADRMMETGHFQELENILNLLPDLDPKAKQKRESNEEEEEEEITSFQATKGSKLHAQRHYRRQTMIFSATLIKDIQWRSTKKVKRKEKRKQPETSADVRRQSIERLIDRLQLPEEPVIFDLTPSGKVSEKIAQYRVEWRGRAILFINAIGEARRIANLLNLLRIRAVLLHSGLQQRQRLKNLETFKQDASSVLIATDVAARGLDIPQVSVVLHFHVPKVPSLYIHRCGRTARGRAEEGMSIMYVTPQEQVHLQKIVDSTGFEIPLRDDDDVYLTSAQKRVHAAKKLEAELNKSGRESRDSSWLRQQAQAMEIDMEESDGEDEEVMIQKRSATQKIRQLQEQLDRLLDAHVLPKGISPRFIAGSQAAHAGLPEMLTHGARMGSIKYADGKRVHRKKRRR
ncbi:hypothetical protein GUITHDRAFT_109675 [Guillardia theta CCMP2712]|uniref:RNA helicase n=1 Tax=Guillardia theta (strain CCMP2712) TaxID=905079 RepID=L1J7Q5_GUITC|nr:hypothetical protein GUITHDRAFT_109675 [Guillardia theta CCMP2712]EKX44561.1 hypothetical protein GUITHDRAFT_109675 [Guillardia theta CCMP2712]|eukprot:XP_005831541.1 hypothetical protein GUITHDRAFT_109675 [Guillardia theta CCMP2712]